MHWHHAVIPSSMRWSARESSRRGQGSTWRATAAAPSRLVLVLLLLCYWSLLPAIEAFSTAPSQLIPREKRPVERHPRLSPPCKRDGRSGCCWPLCDAPKPVWDIKPTRRFKSIREVKCATTADLLLPPSSSPEDPRAAILADLGYGLRPREEFEALVAILDAGSGPGSKARNGKVLVRGVVWFLSLLWPHIGFGLLCSAAAQLLSEDNGMGGVSLPLWSMADSVPDLQKIHGFVGTILGFSIGFRTNAAYDRFYEGRKILCTIMESCRSIIRDAYSFVLKPEGGGEEEDVALVCNDIRRRLDVLFAFIRQSVRESVLGFSPGTGMVHVPFTGDTYYLDPCRPQLLDLLTPSEAERYSHMEPRCRPSAVCSEVNIILQMLGTRFQFTDAFVARQQIHLHQILDAHATMIRIRDTPLPLPYVMILSFATFVFVYTTPFIYNAGFEGRYLGVQFLVFSYYGILQIGSSIENPFAYQAFDIDMEAFGRSMGRDMASTAKAHGEDRRAFLQEYMTQTEESSLQQQQQQERVEVAEGTAVPQPAAVRQ